MPWIVANMKWIMIVSGVLTLTMIYAVIAPADAMKSTFGESLNGPAAELVVRNWGALIAIGGALLLYGAFRPPVRPVILVYTGLGKAIFIALVLRQGTLFLQHQAGAAVVIDSLMILLFAWYLVAKR